MKHFLCTWITGLGNQKTIIIAMSWIMPSLLALLLHIGVLSMTRFKSMYLEISVT